MRLLVLLVALTPAALPFITAGCTSPRTVDAGVPAQRPSESSDHTGAASDAPSMARGVPASPTRDSDEPEFWTPVGRELARVRTSFLGLNEIDAWYETVSEAYGASKRAFFRHRPGPHSGVSLRELHDEGLLGSMDIYFADRSGGDLVYVHVPYEGNEHIYELRDLGVRLRETPAFRERIESKREELLSQVAGTCIAPYFEVSPDGAHHTLYGTVDGEVTVVGGLGFGISH